MPDNKKVAIVCDWIIGGGAEKVVLELHKMYPDAPIYTSYATAEWRQQLDNKVVTGYLQHWPFSKLRKFLPLLRIWWFTNLDFSGYDLVISSSGAEAKGIKTAGDTIHVNYCHAPTHYYWNRFEDYLKEPGFGFFNPLARLGLKLLVGPLRRWDYKAAQRPNFMIANSVYTQSQIKKYYKRGSEVIYPPVDTERFAIAHEKYGESNVRKGYVVIGRQTPYKRIDLAVQACTKLNLPLFVVGQGPEYKRLKKLAGKTVTFLTQVTQTELPHYLQSAEAFIFPGTDDFGIAAVEALAAGTPVIAYKDGGALDYVVEGKTGKFFTAPNAESLAEVLKNFDTSKYSSGDMKSQAQKFSAQSFQRNWRAFLKNVQ